MKVSRSSYAAASGIRLSLVPCLLAVLAAATGCAWRTNSRAVCSAPPQRYTLVPLPLLPSAINDRQQITGITEGHRAAIWSERSGLREIPIPSGFASTAGVAINNSGHVLLMAYDRTFSQHQAFTFSNGRLVQLPGMQTRGFQLNDADKVVGEAAETGTGKTNPVYWSNGDLHKIDTCCGGSAKDIDRQGHVIGDMYDVDGHYFAFRWSVKDGIQRLGPADRFSSALAVNAQGHALIEMAREVDFYDGAALVKLSLAKKFPSHPRAINECDVFVGAYGPFADKYRAFIWDASAGFGDLNDRLVSAAGWKLKSADGINVRGEIVGKGTLANDEDRGYLLIPVSGK
jgi:hypothetical protein